MNSGQGPGTV
uniref:Uncharacterized protein n=1 Tax=Anguilla anguilla TaxID=7936 RepID=A0A0E9TR32_ANGAN